MTHDVTLRTATPADYDRIVAVADEWWGRPVRSLLPRLFLDHFHATSTVAEAGGDLAGFLIGFLSPSLPGAAYVHFVGVHPARRRAGLARTLYQRFFDLAAADGRTVVRAVTSPSNERSIAFHSALGFTVTGPVPGYDGPGDLKVRFERALRLPRAGTVVDGPQALSRDGGSPGVTQCSQRSTNDGAGNRGRQEPLDKARGGAGRPRIRRGFINRR